ncbi:uncharacterized protein LOC110846646 isoform X2 [Folsomia candida]|uniref:uncharacterized protein LOC110846646 isoform X2 n=1 Tax=Folsomia candida TaxID=158441 RepID=UPI001604D513|nr:uncharacterized protein LOC110846646 isoform X2 [Folsomia candida]
MMTVTQNNVYVHSSPPKAISGQGAAIRSWVRSGDLDKLESVILEGQGARLLGLMESSNDPKVRAFLKSVPSYMAKVDLIHDAVTRGSLRETQSLLDKRKLAVARDAVGRGLAHKAVLYGHKSLLDWLGRKFPEVVHLRDNEGRTPLHYTASSHTNSSTPDLYPLLLTLGASPDIPDLHGKKPPYYQAHPEDLDIESPFNNQRSLSRNKTLSRRISPTTPNKYQSNAYIPPPNSVTRAQIRIWIHERDIKKLEQIVWAGQGDKLLLETTNNSKVRRFLDNVPHLLGLNKDIHAACVAGDVGRVKALRERARGVEEVFMAKDQYGVTGVMKATHLGHRPLLEYFAYEFPKELKSARDSMGRSVLDYATTPSMASFLTKMLDEVPTNSNELSDLEIRRLRHLPDAPRVVGELGEWDRGGSGAGHEWGKSSIKRKQSSGEEEFGGSPIEDRIPSGRDTSVGGGGTKYRRAGVTSNGGGGGGGPASLRGDDDEKVEIVDVGDQYVVDEELVGEKYELGNVVLEGMDFEVDDDDEGDGRASGRGGNDDELEKELERITGEEQEEELVEKGEVLREEMEAEMAQKEEEENVEAELMESMDQSRITSPMKEPIKTPEVEVEPEEEQITDQTPPPRTPTPRLATPQVPPRSPTPVENDAAKELPPLPDVVTAEDVDQLIQDGNMESLVTLVLDGKGSLLVNRTPTSSMHPEVAEFLTNVPAYMAKIASIHSAANNGNLRDLQSLLDRKRLAQARDERGRVALHMAVLGGHAGVVRYLIGNYQGTDIPDNSGRTPLHYAATLPDHGTMYKILIQSGADPNIKDINDNPPGVYLRRKDLLTREELMDPVNGSSKPKTPAEVNTWERPPSPQPEDGGHDDDPAQGKSLYLKTTQSISSPADLELDLAQLQLLDAFYNQIHQQESSIWVKTWRKLRKSGNDQARIYIRKYLPFPLYEEIKGRSTPRFGATLLDCIKFYPQYFLIAPDPHCYWVFRELFLPVVRDGGGGSAGGGGNLVAECGIKKGMQVDIKNVDIAAKFVREVRIRLSRNLRPYPFVSLLRREGLEEISGKVEKVFGEKLANWERVDYERLMGEKEEREEREGGGRGVWPGIVEATKISRFWPKSRYVWINPDNSAQIWIHAQDHIDFIVRAMYGRVGPLLVEMSEIYDLISQDLDYHWSSEVGFLTVDPFRAGTGMKVTFRLRLPHLMLNRLSLLTLLNQNSLCLNKWHGKSSNNLTATTPTGDIDPEDWIEVENSKTFGLNEVELAKRVVDGVGEVIKVEEALCREHDLKATGGGKK